MEFAYDLDRSLAVLKSGGLILYPTDTIWGIGCDATNPLAVRRVFALKKREETKSLIVLVADERDILTYVSQPDPSIFEFLRTLEKPTTIIYQGAVGLADNLVNADGTVAIRLVKDSFCRHLIKRMRKPLVSTSANISGQPSPANFDEITPQIIHGVDYVVSYRQSDRTHRAPSTILKLERDGTRTVIRP